MNQSLISLNQVDYCLPPLMNSTSLRERITVFILTLSTQFMACEQTWVSLAAVFSLGEERCVTRLKTAAWRDETKNGCEGEYEQTWTIFFCITCDLGSISAAVSGQVYVPSQTAAGNRANLRSGIFLWSSPRDYQITIQWVAWFVSESKHLSTG